MYYILLCYYEDYTQTSGHDFMERNVMIVSYDLKKCALSITNIYIRNNIFRYM